MNTNKAAYLTFLYIVLTGCLFALGFWLLETWVHVQFFHGGSIATEIWPDDSNELWMRLAISGMFILSSLIIGFFVTCILKLKEQSMISEHTLAFIFESLMVTNNESEIIHVNNAFEETTGYKRSEVLGKNPNLLSSGKQDTAFYEKFWQTLKETGHWQGEIWNRRKNGELYPEWLSISTVKENNDQVKYYIALFTDITSQKAVEERIRHYAYHDPLTGLPNRRLFTDRFLEAIARTDRNKQLIATVFLDLDGFKQINDEHNHHIGDLYLKASSNLIQQSIRKDDLLARVGGDEFLILVTSLDNLAQAEQAIQRLNDSIQQQEIKVSQLSFRFSASIGVSIYPKDSNNANELIGLADKAMYKVKKQGKGGVKLWNSID